MRTPSVSPTAPWPCRISSGATGPRRSHGSSTGSRHSGRGTSPPASHRSRRVGLDACAARRGERGDEATPGGRTALRAPGRAGARWSERLGLPRSRSRLSAARPARRGAAPKQPCDRMLSVSPRVRRPCPAFARRHRDPPQPASTPRGARPTITRPWPLPSRVACVPSSLTATSGSASSTGAQAGGRRRKRTSPLLRRCTARWACSSGWRRRRRG